MAIVDIKEDNFELGELTPAKIRSMYRRFIIMGFSRVEASNLIAKLVGLGTTDKGWKVDEITRLIFLQHIEDKLPK